MFVYLRIRWAYFNGLCFTVEVRRRLFLHQQLGAVDGGSQGTSLFFPRSQTMWRVKRSTLSLVSPLTLTRPDKAFPLWSAHHAGYPAPVVNSFHLQSTEMTFHSGVVPCWWWTVISEGSSEHLDQNKKASEDVQCENPNVLLTCWPYTNCS